MSLPPRLYTYTNTCCVSRRRVRRCLPLLSFTAAGSSAAVLTLPACSAFRLNTAIARRAPPATLRDAHPSLRLLPSTACRSNAYSLRRRFSHAAMLRISTWIAVRHSRPVRVTGRSTWISLFLASATLPAAAYCTATAAAIPVLVTLSRLRFL